MSWFSTEVFFKDESKELVNAWLINLGTDAIEEKKDHFLAYFENPENIKSLYKAISELTGVVSVSQFMEQKEANWNAVWEENFEPIAIDNKVFIRANFHEPNSSYAHEIMIAPKMAFGTGHHETTYMMIRKLAALDLGTKSVFDYGCGTGILSIYCLQKDCDEVIGVDIEGPAIENSHEHIQLNSLTESNYEFLLGDIDLVEGKTFDLVLANINRKVLLENVQRIREVVKGDGILLLSGILQVDKPLIMEAYAPYFSLQSLTSKGEWLCFEFKKRL